MQAAGLEPKDLDLIICGTITPEMAFPSHRLLRGGGAGAGLRRRRSTSPAACSGFLYALDIGAQLRPAPAGTSNVLVIGAETLSRITDYTDRGSCILFGDGAGAVVLQRSDDPNRGLIYSSAARRRQRLGDAPLPARQPAPDQRRR